jgi:hypothetical protein
MPITSKMEAIINFDREEFYIIAYNAALFLRNCFADGADFSSTLKCMQSLDNSGLDGISFVNLKRYIETELSDIETTDKSKTEYIKEKLQLLLSDYEDVTKDLLIPLALVTKHLYQK